MSKRGVAGSIEVTIAVAGCVVWLFSRYCYCCVCVWLCVCGGGGGTGGTYVFGCAHYT